jgi:hypothetical protein
MEVIMNELTIKGFTYSKENLSSFEIIGFTQTGKFPESFFLEIMKGDKLEILKGMNPKNKRIFYMLSDDEKFSWDTIDAIRYTIGVIKDENYVEDKNYKELFTMKIKESEWVIFSKEYDNGFQHTYDPKEFRIIKDYDPWEMLKETEKLDRVQRISLNSISKIEVFNFNGNKYMLELWVPVKTD